MRPTIAGVWLTCISSIWNWIYTIYFHFVHKWNHVFVQRNNNGVADRTTKDSKARDINDSIRIPHATYDVFVNHRGPDVKLTFAAHLTDALRRAGFHPFLDAKSIREGNHVFKSIDEGLSRVNVHVAIFSTGYAESKYCLDELCAMLQSQKVIIPVFYDVQPEDLRYVQSGPFAKGFRKHLSRHRHEDVQKWKDALLQVAEFRGFRKDEVSGDESQLVKNIVVAVQRASAADLQLPQNSPKFGLDESLQEVVDTLTTMQAENVGVLALTGMGGIGKTTLASEIYNHYISRREFHHHSFLKDVRSTPLLELQHQLVNNLLREDTKFTPEKYQHWFDTFRSHKLLVIVDDIDTTSQFEALIPDIPGLAPGSRIVVTSRHRDVANLVMRPAKRKELYEVKVLKPVEARKLFNWHAFYSEDPPGKGNFQKLAADVADACGGHPLALEVIGRSLFNKKDLGDEAIWTDAVRTLQEHTDITEKLKISYTSLPSDGDRAMFRDIACLLIGMRKDVAMELWNSCKSCAGGFCSTTKGPSQALRRLEDKSLVHLDAGLRFVMHDVIRDMGRDVVIKESCGEPWQRTHLWDAATAAKVLKKNVGRCGRIRGIKLSSMESKSTPTYAVEKFESMDELHFLILDGCLLTGKDYSKLSEELRWLQWRSFPGTHLPSRLDLPNLVVLDLASSNLSSLWQEDDHIEFPALQRLILTNCRELKELPQNLGDSIPKVRTIEMENCSHIAALPKSVGELNDLEQLILSGCEILESLPDTVVNLTQLKRLLLQDCRKLQNLPQDLGRLFHLEVLNLHNCGELLQLPDINGLRKLKELHMTSTCNRDGQLLTFMGALTALKALHLCKNEAITVLPQSFGDLKSLFRLQISFCQALEIVEALPRSLQYLDMANCPKLSRFPSLADATSLISLNLCNCISLTQIGGLECLTALEEITIAGCTSLLQTEQRQVMRPSKGLRLCYLSGSNVALVYNNKWSEAEPAQQLISYYDDSIGYIPNGMPQNLVAREWSHELTASTTILSDSKCLAVIFAFVLHDQGWSSYPWDHGHYNGHCFMDVWIMRDGMRLYDSRLFTARHGDERNQVYLCTFRRKHPFVQSLKVGDKICVYARSQYPGWRITVQEGAIAVVHEEEKEEDVAIEMNSKLLSKGRSKELVDNFDNLVLMDHCSSSLESKFGRIESDHESESESEPESASEVTMLASEAGSLSIHTQNPDTFEVQEWHIEPAYGLYSWAQSWKLPKPGQGVVSFEAQGRNDIHVAMSEQRHSRHPMYEIVIGGWMNTASAIRRTRGDIEASFVAVGLSNPGGPNRLWISVDARTAIIQVGRGEPFQDVIAIYKDSDFYSGIRNISFTTNDTPITYSNVAIADMEQPTPVLDTYELSETVVKQVLNDAWVIPPVHGHYSWAHYWMLPRPGRGIISFTAEETEDIHVAVSARPQNVNPMYEINFGNWGNNRTLIRRNVKGPLGPIQCGVEYGGLTSGGNQLWVSLDDRSGIIQLGRGEPGQNMFCVYKDPAFLSEARYFSFSNLDSPVTISNVALTEIL